MKKNLRTGSVALALGGLTALAGVAQADLPGYGLQRLFMVSEWKRLCDDLGTPEKAANCRISMHRAMINGRSVDIFELIDPVDPNLLQTRSGVLFHPSLNKRIVRVKEDNGMRTTVQMPSDIQCQAYAAAPDLVGVPLAGRDYTQLIQSWLEVYTDTPSSIGKISVGEQGGRRVLRFDALTWDNRVVRGVYMLDAQSNASIFSTCDHPVASAQAQRDSELFFDSIVGSVRRFI